MSDYSQEHDFDLAFDRAIRTLEEFPEPDERRDSRNEEFAQIQPGARFANRRGIGPDVEITRVTGALVYFFDGRRVDFCGLPFFLAQFSLLPAPEAV